MNDKDDKTKQAYDVKGHGNAIRLLADDLNGCAKYSFVHSADIKRIFSNVGEYPRIAGACIVTVFTGVVAASGFMTYHMGGTADSFVTCSGGVIGACAVTICSRTGAVTACTAEGAADAVIACILKDACLSTRTTYTCSALRAHTSVPGVGMQISKVFPALIIFGVHSHKKYKTTQTHYVILLRKNKKRMLLFTMPEFQTEMPIDETWQSQLDEDFCLCLISDIPCSCYHPMDVYFSEIYDDLKEMCKIATIRQMFDQTPALSCCIQTILLLPHLTPSCNVTPKEILERKQCCLQDTVYQSVSDLNQEDSFRTNGSEKNRGKLKEISIYQYLTMALIFLTLILVILITQKEVTLTRRLSKKRLKIKDSTTEIREIHRGSIALNGKPDLHPIDPVEGNRAHNRQRLLKGFAIARDEVHVVPVATSASVQRLSVDLNHLMILSYGCMELCMPSFSDVRKTVLSKSHLKQFTSYTDVYFYPKNVLEECYHHIWDCQQVFLDRFEPIADEMIKVLHISKNKFPCGPILAMTSNPGLKGLERSVGEAIGFLSSLKRKELPEDHNLNGIVKRRRYVAVATQPTEEFDFNEDIEAFSLIKKKLVSVAMVNFLNDLKSWNRKRQLQVIQESFNEEIVESIEITEKDSEVLKFDLTNPIHKRQSFCFVGHVTDKDVLIETLRLANNDKLSIPLRRQEEGNTLSKVTNAVIITHSDFALNQEEIEWTSSKAVIFTNETLEAALTGVEEEIGNETAGVETCARKKLEIRIQNCPSKFEKQSDVTCISIDKFQRALSSVRRDAFVNLAGKNFKGSSYKEDQVHFKCNQRRFNEEKPSENIEVALPRELMCIKNVELPDPQIDFGFLLRAIQVFHIRQFEPVMAIIDQIANGTPPTPHVSMRYELLRFCTLRSYPKENKPYLIKLAEAGFYYASDSDGVVCYCCGIRRYNWVAKDDPMKVHQRINPDCKYLKKNEEVNVPVQYFGPYSEKLMYIMSIPEPVDRPQVREDVNNDWAPERIRSPASVQQSSQNEIGTNALGINTAIPKHPAYATKTTRETSYNGWPDSSSHTPQELSDAGFFYAGFGDCVRCFYCGIGLRHWTKEDDPWIEHARWSRNCVYLRQKKGEEFVNLVQFALQYSQKEAEAEESNASGNQVPVLDIEKILLSDAAQSVLEMGYPPIKIKRAIEEILRQSGNVKITAAVLMQKVLDIEEEQNPPQSAPAPTPAPAAAATKKTAESSAHPGKPASIDTASNSAKGKTEGAAVRNTSTTENDKSRNTVGSKEEAKLQDPKAIKAENEQLKEQTLCKVCLDNTVCIVFLPCGHLVTCADCAPAMRKCPICRALVKGTVRTYMS